MAIVNGVVKAVSTKYDKYSIKVGDTWYGTKMEWATVKPEPGESVTFENGGGKFTKNMKITSQGSVQPAGKTDATPSAPKNYSLGVELGHASNLAMRMTEYLSEDQGANTSPNAFLDLWERNTMLIYSRMQRLRKVYEGEGAITDAKADYLKDEIAKVTEAGKPKAKATVEEDDIPF